MTITAQPLSISIDQILREIERGNEKYGHGPLADEFQTSAILMEEVGEYAQTVLKGQMEEARKELIQVCAVALNHLCGHGPHYSKL